MLRHSHASFARHPKIGDIFVAVGEGQEAAALTATHGLRMPTVVIRGATRSATVHNGLEAIAAAGGSDFVLIHDAARPFLPARVIDELIDALFVSTAAVPALPIVDSLARGTTVLTDTVERENLWRVQTPQAFHFEAIIAAHRRWSGPEPTDDARMLMANGDEIAIVPGDEALAKFTFASDFEDYAMTSDCRVGSGFDVHRLVPNEELWLCGVRIPHHLGLSGHSDADVAIHALTDAILGAVALGDIGDHFPPSESQWKGASSDRFLSHAVNLAREIGYEVSNADVTIICEAPKIGPHRAAMRERLAQIMALDVNQISVKATTTELLGFTGRGEGIAAQAIVSLQKAMS